MATGPAYMPILMLFPVLVAVFVSLGHELKLRKRLAKISRDLDGVLRQNGISSLDFLSAEKMTRFVSSKHLLGRIEAKIQTLQNGPEEK